MNINNNQMNQFNGNNHINSMKQMKQPNQLNLKLNLNQLSQLNQVNQINFLSGTGSYNSNIGSDYASPRIQSISPSVPLAFEYVIQPNESLSNDDIQMNMMIQENEQYLQMIENSLKMNIAIQPSVFLSFQRNLNGLMSVSQHIAQPNHLPFASFQLLVPPQLQGIGMKSVVQTQCILNWSFPL